MSKWDEMTEEEREEYVNQDCSARHWRENIQAEMGRGKYNDAVDSKSLADAICSTEYEKIKVKLNLTPFERVCFSEYYGQGKTYRQIADSMDMAYRVDGVICALQPVTWNMVNRQMRLLNSKINELRHLSKDNFPLNK